MPEMDGYQVLERIKGDPQIRDIPVIVISALDETESAVRCIENGAEDYLPKSFDPVLLRARLNASLQKKKLRDLEKAYLEQEMMLRQNEKQATIGRLSAGMAHELNNPVAAVKRGAANMAQTILRLQHIHRQLVGLSLTEQQLKRMSVLDELAQERAREPLAVDPLTRSDNESDLEAWLELLSLTDAWEIAPKLVDLGLSKSQLEKLSTDFQPTQFPVVLQWLVNTCEVYKLIEDIGQTSSRIADIVAALKVYTFLDQAPVQNVDIHAGLDSTITVLQSKLNGINVKRNYAADMPQIEAYGSELNQVWTNLIENAIEAMDGEGEISLQTHREINCVIVEIEDNGSGIPEDIQGHIFDPFFTTKPPGLGTGLGLNVSHNIVVQKHKGRLEVHSKPGKTRFQVRLPLALV
jgi:signal transduction histidine kinase